MDLEIFMRLPYFNIFNVVFQTAVISMSKKQHFQVLPKVNPNLLLPPLEHSSVLFIKPFTLFLQQETAFITQHDITRLVGFFQGQLSLCQRRHTPRATSPRSPLPTHRVWIGSWESRQRHYFSEKEIQLCMWKGRDKRMGEATFYSAEGSSAKAGSTLDFWCFWRDNTLRIVKGNCRH